MKSSPTSHDRAARQPWAVPARDTCKLRQRVDVALLAAWDRATADAPRLDVPNVGNGLALLRGLGDNISPLAFLDPQHRSNLDHLRYGNEGLNRGQRRAALRQQSQSDIAEIGQEIRRVLKPSGYCARWCNTYEVLEGLFGIEGLKSVAMVTWDNGGTGMGGRARTCGAHLVLMQKPPVGVRAKSLSVIWKTKPVIRAARFETIRFPRAAHPHKKPIGLTQEIILAVTEPGDVVLDPCAGSFTTLSAALGCGRHFLGTDLVSWDGGFGAALPQVHRALRGPIRDLRVSVERPSAAPLAATPAKE